MNKLFMRFCLLVAFSMSGLWAAASDNGKDLYDMLKEDPSVNIVNQLKKMSGNKEAWESFFTHVAQDEKFPELPPMKKSSIKTNIGSLKVFGVDCSKINVADQLFNTLVVAAKSKQKPAEELTFDQWDADRQFNLLQSMYFDRNSENKTSLQDFKEKFDQAKLDAQAQLYVHALAHRDFSGATSDAHKMAFLVGWPDLPKGSFDYSRVNKIIESLLTKKGPENLQTKEQVIQFLKKKMFKDGNLSNGEEASAASSGEISFFNYIKSEKYQKNYHAFSGWVNRHFDGIKQGSGWPEKFINVVEKEEDDSWMEEGQGVDPDDILGKNREFQKIFQKEKETSKASESIPKQSNEQKVQAQSTLSALFGGNRTPSSQSIPSLIDDPFEMPISVLSPDSQATANQKKYEESLSQGFLALKNWKKGAWPASKKIENSKQLIEEMNEIGVRYFGR